MPRTNQARQAGLGSVLTRHADSKDTSYAGVFYVGLGDRFDDDRRLVREAGLLPFRQRLRERPHVVDEKLRERAQ
jgi:hypothetical protein